MLIMACSKEEMPSRDELIQVEVDDRADKFLKEKIERCQKTYMSQIEYEVDSMMYFLVQKIKGQDGQMPPKPSRPDRLVDTIKLDSFYTPEN